MPSGDKTGPEGRGPMTGRKAGFCAGSQVPGYENPRQPYGFGRGLGRGYRRGYEGRGRGFWRRGEYTESPHFPITYPQKLSKEEEKVYLEDTAKNLEEDIKSIRKRIEELSNDK